jgi:nitroimidazol reductase NimA-like FMN-containing flavoprotein (pyridoxamine 5'-phosphate oxidase superfamily)
MRKTPRKPPDREGIGLAAEAIMVIHELSRSECLAVLGRNSLGRLGYSRFDQPHIVPIYYSFDADRDMIYGFSMLGEKVEWMRRNPKVCLEVDEIADKDHWTSVLIVGRYREIHRDPRELESRRRAEQLFQQRAEWWLPGAAKLTSKEAANAVLYRISLDKMSGRRASRAGPVSGIQPAGTISQGEGNSPAPTARSPKTGVI